MNSESPSTVTQFRNALIDCKRLYISAARQALEGQGNTDESVRHDFIRRMVDLHKGLLLKIYTTIATADRRWSREERLLAQELIDHLWQERLDGPRLRDVTLRLFSDAGSLKWYSLVRPFDQISVLHERVAELETIVTRVGNLVAKADGSVDHRESVALRSIQQELEVHLRRLTLDDTEPTESESSQATQAIQIAPLESSHGRHAQKQKPQDDEVSALAAEDSEDSLKRALDDLNQLIGLQEVKHEIRTLTNLLDLQQHRRKAGLPQVEMSLHMVFMGNPGTGKTTVARIVGRIYRALGVLEKGHVVETDRSGLVAEYAGQTGPKTHRKVDEALDGVLFIDEAYSLVTSRQEDAYGQEAVQALIKRIEDDRNRLIVILAGYSEPMEQLLLSNPGMKSRFNTRLTFKDFSPVDLGRIFQSMCETNGYVLSAATRAKLLQGFKWLYDQRDENFGNGRLVRNVFEKTVRRLANRIANEVPVTRELLTCFQAEDIAFRDVPAEQWKLLETGTVRYVVICPKCQRSAKVKGQHLGKTFRCPKCHEPFVADWGMPEPHAPRS